MVEAAAAHLLGQNCSGVPQQEGASAAAGHICASYNWLSSPPPATQIFPLVLVRLQLMLCVIYIFSHQGVGSLINLINILVRSISCSSVLL